MQEILNVLGGLGTWFDAFLKHISLVSAILSLGFGWGAAIFFSFPLHHFIKDDKLATWCTRAVAVACSFFITFRTWPNDWRLEWALFMCVLSPVLGWAALKWIETRWPVLAAELSMKKSAPSTCAPPVSPPGDTQ